MNYELVPLQQKGDSRGYLVVLETNKEIPFDVKRIYYLFGTKPGIRRGFHAHHSLWQMAVVLAGSCEFLMDDGLHQENIKLDDNRKALLLPPYIWHEMFNFTPECVLMVLASEHYDESDYIRNYDDFLDIVKKREQDS